MRVGIRKLVKNLRSIYKNNIVVPRLDRGIHPNGFSLIEILVSLAILSFCLLGIIGTMTLSLARAENSYFRTIAVMQTANLAEASKAGLAENYLATWNQQNSLLLPEGQGKYKVVEKGHEISVCWQLKLLPQECNKVLI